jgi:ADP-ribosylglycohydrolase
MDSTYTAPQQTRIQALRDAVQVLLTSKVSFGVGEIMRLARYIERGGSQ